MFVYADANTNATANVPNVDINDINVDEIYNKQQQDLKTQWAAANSESSAQFVDVPIKKQYFKESYIVEQPESTTTKTTNTTDSPPDVDALLRKHEEELSIRYNLGMGWGREQQTLLQRKKEQFEYGLQEFTSLYNSFSLVIVGALWAFGWQIFNRQYPRINYQHMRYWRTPNHAGPRQLEKYERMCWLIGTASAGFYHAAQTFIVQYAGLDKVPAYLGDEGLKIYKEQLDRDKLTNVAHATPLSFLFPTTTPVTTGPHNVWDDQLIKLKAKINKSMRDGTFVKKPTLPPMWSAHNVRSTHDELRRRDIHLGQEGISNIYGNVDYWLHNDTVEWIQGKFARQKPPNITDEQYNFLISNQHIQKSSVKYGTTLLVPEKRFNRFNPISILREGLMVTEIHQVFFGSDNEFIKSKPILGPGKNIVYIVHLNKDDFIKNAPSYPKNKWIVDCYKIDDD